MPTAQKTVKPVINFRHDQGVKDFVDNQAAEQNLFPAALYRNIFNAGFEAMYQLKIRNNKIVTPLADDGSTPL